jgi:hypothetical protein
MRATAGQVSDVYERYFGVPKPTSRDFAQRLRKDPALLRRGKQGPNAPELTISELTNWTIALVAATATTRKCPDAVETVRLARAARRLDSDDLEAYCQPEALEGLAVARATTAGAAIDSLLSDMRSGAFRAWKSDGPTSLSIRFFNNGGRIVINTLRFKNGQMQKAALVFRSDGHPADRAYSLIFIHQIEGDALEALAALGTPD